MKLGDVLTFGEAAKIYNLSDGSVLRNDVKRGKFRKSDYRKAGKVWIIKKSAVERVYGDRVKNT